MSKPPRTLVIVDIQKAFEPPPEFLGRLERYAKRFELRVFTRYVNPPGSLFRRLLKQTSCLPGTPDTELMLTPQKGDFVLEKRSYGLSEAAIARLKRRGVKKAIVCGLDTDACVLAVMFSLFDAGIDVRLKQDLCWSSSGLQDPALEIIKAQFPKPL
ncbi:MAG: isochorismatase family cysteine hydrolase [Opitutaceae bacterium]|nr:isochorismatase family cysteine hydrolase [Opitutaceae bacterium]